MLNADNICPSTPLYTCSGGNVVSIQLGSAASTAMNGTISTLIGRLTALTSLSLDGFKNLTSTIPAGLNLLTNLASLSFFGCSLNGPLPVDNLTKMTYLRLGGNNFSGTLPIAKMTDLSFLSSSGQSFTGTLPSTMSLMSKLVVVYLFGNQGLTGTVPDLSLLSNLVDL